VPRVSKPLSSLSAKPETTLPLTAREGEILFLLAQGLNTSEIATRLSITRTTVRNHSQRVLAKLSVHNRLAAVARGYALGLIRLPAQRVETLD
jgi:DNA-binding CsgD family transcriptional regulator